MGKLTSAEIAALTTDQIGVLGLTVFAGITDTGALNVPTASLSPEQKAAFYARKQAYFALPGNGSKTTADFFAGLTATANAPTVTELANLTGHCLHRRGITQRPCAAA
jgi:hypothetical protein